MSHQALRKSHGSNDHCTEFCVTCWKCCMKKNKKTKQKKNEKKKRGKNLHMRSLSWLLDSSGRSTPWDPPQMWLENLLYTRGGSRRERTRRAPPLKLEKIWFLHEIPQKNFAPPSARRNFFKCTPPNLKSWIRPCILLM